MKDITAKISLNARGLRERRLGQLLNEIGTIDARLNADMIMLIMTKVRTDQPLYRIDAEAARLLEEALLPPPSIIRRKGLNS